MVSQGGVWRSRGTGTIPRPLPTVQYRCTSSFWLTTLTAAVVAPSASSAGAVRAPRPRSRDRHWVGFDDAVAAVAAQPGVRARRTRHARAPPPSKSRARGGVARRGRTRRATTSPPSSSFSEASPPLPDAGRRRESWGMALESAIRTTTTAESRHRQLPHATASPTFASVNGDATGVRRRERGSFREARRSCSAVFFALHFDPPSA